MELEGIKFYMVIAVTLVAIMFIWDKFANSKAIAKIREELEKLKRERIARSVLDLILEEPDTVAGLMENSKLLRAFIQIIRPARSELERMLFNGITAKINSNHEKVDGILGRMPKRSGGDSKELIKD